MKELKVGLFTLFAGILFVVMIIRITATNATFGSFYDYKAKIKDASGIFENSLIRVAGIEAGYITSINLENDMAVVTFKVQEKLLVTKNTKLQVKTVGFLGEKYLDLTLGPPLPERLPPDSIIEVQENVGIEGLAEDASAIMVDVKDITAKVRAALKNDKTDNVVKDIINDLQDTMKTVKRIASRNEEAINLIIDDIGQISSSLAYETNPEEADSLLSKVREVGPVIDNLKSASNDLKEIMADVHAGKGTVGKLLRDEEVVDQVNDTLKNVNQLVSRINNIEADISIFSGVNSDNGSHTQLDLDLYPAPERFYRLGVVVNDFGPFVSENTKTTTTTDGVRSVQEKEEVDEDAIKFNLQIGRVYQRFGFRAGLIETTGGIGIDYYLNEYGIRFGTELFDFANDEGANLRVFSDVRLWNVFYGRLAFEDVLNDTRSATISAGLRFTDEDLASLIGLLAR